MKNTIIKQRDIKEEDGFCPYEDLKIRINEGDVELQQGRDVVSISKLKLAATIEWLYNNGCEMSFVNVK